MNISKTTIKAANRLGWDLIINEDEVFGKHIWLCRFNENGESECEPDISFFINSDCFTFKESLSIHQNVIGEIPATIFSEKQFRNVLKYIAENN